MEAATFLIQLVVILITSRLAGEIAAYFKAPSVIGELLAGILIGPSLLNLIDLTPSIQLLAQIGIILLLFEVGLETDISRLTAAGKKAVIVATGGIILPFAFGFIISYYVFNFNLLISLFIGSTLTATSIGITLRVLKDLNKQSSQESQIIIGAAVIDDIVGIILLAMLYEFATSGTVNLWNAASVLLFILLFFLITPFVAKTISLIIKKWSEKTEIPGLLPTTIVSLILFFAWLAHYLGAPELLGGFAAGLALSPNFPFLKSNEAFSHRIEKEMKPIIHLFTPIFFVAIGLSLNFKLLDWSSSYIWILTSTLLIVAIAGKLFSSFALTKESLRSKFIIGTSMVPRGEVGLIFANIGLTSSVLKEDIYASLVLVIALTTLLAPFALRYIYTKD